jgi:hypothetical protein
MFLAILRVLVMQCRDLVLCTSLVVLLVLWMQSKDLLLLRTSRAISRVLVLQLQDLLLPTLLDDAVFFVLILERFIGNFFVLSFVSNCMSEREKDVVCVAKIRMLRTVS